MRVFVLVGGWLSLSLPCLAVSIAPAHGAYESGAAASVEDDSWSAISLTKQHRLNRPEACINIIGGGGEALKAGTLENVKAGLFIDAVFGPSSWVTDDSYFLPQVTLLHELWPKAALDVLLQTDVLCLHLLQDE